MQPLAPPLAQPGSYLHLEEPPSPNLRDRELEEARRKLERDLKFGGRRAGAPTLAAPCTISQACRPAGEAVRAIREDVPQFFNVRPAWPVRQRFAAWPVTIVSPARRPMQVKRPQNYSIFREDVTLVDDISPHVGLGRLRSNVHGRAQYRRRLNALRAVIALLVRVDEVPPAGSHSWKGPKMPWTARAYRAVACCPPATLGRPPGQADPGPWLRP